MLDIVVVGLGTIAEIAWAYFSSDSNYNVVAFSAEEKYINEYGKKTFLGNPVVPLDNLPSLYPPSQFKAFIAIGYNKLNHIRARIYRWMCDKGYELVSYINSKAYIDDTCKIGNNCFILEHNVLQRNVVIGNDTFLWSGNHIGHSSVLGEHVFLSSHVAVSGFCKIGNYCFLGINCCIGDSLTIADNCFIGGGVTITRSTPPNAIYRSIMPTPERLTSSDVFGFNE